MLQGLPRPDLIAVHARGDQAGGWPDGRSCAARVARRAACRRPRQRRAVRPRRTRPSRSAPPDFVNRRRPGDATTYDGEPLSTTDPTNGRCQENGTLTQRGAGHRHDDGHTTVWWSFTGTGGPRHGHRRGSELRHRAVGRGRSRAPLRQASSSSRSATTTSTSRAATSTSELVLNTSAGKTYLRPGRRLRDEAAATHAGSGDVAAVHIYPPPRQRRPRRRPDGSARTRTSRANWGATSSPASGPRASRRTAPHRLGKTVWYRYIDAGGRERDVSTRAASTPSVDASTAAPAPRLQRRRPTGGTGTLTLPSSPRATISSQVGGLGLRRRRVRAARRDDLPRRSATARSLDDDNVSDPRRRPSVTQPRRLPRPGSRPGPRRRARGR